MPILVTTPNGTVGRYLTEALRDRSDVRFLVRSEAGAKALGKIRGEVFRGDVTDAADVRGAVAGVDRLYLAHPFAEDQVAAETNLGLAAIEAGARRIIKLGARAFSGNGIVPDAVTSAHDTITERLRSAGVPELTVLQPDRFLQNFLPAAAAIAKGTLADPAGPGARGYVDVRDIAEVAIAELLAAHPIGGEIEISGPQTLTLPVLCERFGAVLGRPVRYVDIPLDGAWRATLADRGITPQVIDGLQGLYSNYHQEGVAGLGDGVQRVLGRPPRSVEDFATDLLMPAVSGT
ncbi:NmrA family NAD(P)-binding protein [Streptomyces sp. ID38640]|uniref:NmrA family NAD(P)-binding protein n=1 Tax=Streptomyces sp. ID38640 TaxID=1265399 RepID=UPI00140EB83D|nr:NmrA family NAD(P)-binding protein [Streptomyces sp. ID38640]QIK11733.1 NmrA family NAD(P)-binding protein [Streptomyces sp. ID38640]